MCADFKESAKKFLDSVVQKDFALFKSFLNHDELFFAVLPDGRSYQNIENFVAHQTSWFEGKTGSFSYSIQRLEESGQLGFLAINANYANVDQYGDEFELEIYISFVFKNISNQWKLIHDQNTLLRKVK